MRSRLAVLRGITVFAASGDSGSYDCQRSKFSDHRLTVDFPSDSPQVVVGRRDAPLGADERRVRHRGGWEGPFSNAGGGGGINTFDAGSLVAGGRACRERTAGGSRRVREREPDERLARPRLRQLGLVRRHERGDAVLGGLDAAAEQLAAKQGVKRTLLPRADPLHSSPRRISPTRRSTTWSPARTGYYDAGPGWDYATGLGSPDVYNLARDLVAYLRTNPCGPSS